MFSWQLCLKRHYLRTLVLCLVTLKIGEPAPSTMKAVVIETFGGPNVLKYRVQYPVPMYDEDQILVKVEAAGVMPIDVYVRSGSCEVLPELPAILGKEIAGYVEEVGSNVVKFQPGDRIYCGIESGGYAQYAVANESSCFILSEMLSFAQGASLYLSYFCLFKAFSFRGGVSQGNLVLINGASGFFGAAAVQIAKEFETRVVASVGSDIAAKLMRESGADIIADYKDGNFMQNTLKSARKSGFDLILELLPTLQLSHDRQFLTNDGKIIVMGHRVPPSLYGKGVYAVSYFKMSEEEKKAAAEFLHEHIEMGCIRPNIAKEYDLHTVYKAHQQITHNNTEKNKIVLIIN